MELAVSDASSQDMLFVYEMINKLDGHLKKQQSRQNSDFVKLQDQIVLAKPAQTADGFANKTDDLQSENDKTDETPQIPDWLNKLTIKGQVRFRQEFSRKQFSPDTDINDVEYLRSRLSLSFRPGDNVTAFLQFQDSRTFGLEGGNTLANDSNIDLHQGYILLDNLFNKKGLYLQVGRMEIAHGGQRLIGSVGWHNVGRAFDGGRLVLSRKNFYGELWAVKLDELFEEVESKDKSIKGLDLTFKPFPQFSPRGYIILENDNKTNESGEKMLNRNTYGIHTKGKVNSFDYEFEAALQSGKQAGKEIKASLLGISGGYKFPVKNNFRVAVGYDRLSGNDGALNTVKDFNTLYATNHKFYGYMDYFLNIPVHTRGFGLKDYMVKTSAKLSSELIGKVDFHIFRYAENDENGDSDLGKEIDLTLVYSYSAPVKITLGASTFLPGEVYKKSKGDRKGLKFYSMMTLSF